jgi:hypothetical protein
MARYAGRARRDASGTASDAGVVTTDDPDPRRPRSPLLAGFREVLHVAAALRTGRQTAVDAEPGEAVPTFVLVP